MGAIKGVLEGSFNSYLVGRTLWTAEARPLFGNAIEAFPFGKIQLRVFAHIQVNFGRYLLNSDRMSVAVVLGQLSWPTSAKVFYRKKISFATRISDLDPGNLIRLALCALALNPGSACCLARSFTYNGPAFSVNMLHPCVSDVQVARFFFDFFVTEWRVSVKKMAFKSFFYYKAKLYPEAEKFYHGSPKSVIFLQCRTGFLALRWKSYYYDNLGLGKCCPACAMCDQIIFHFLLECPGLTTDRQFIAEARSLLKPENGVLDSPLEVLCSANSFRLESAKLVFAEKAKSYVFSRWQEREAVMVALKDNLCMNQSAKHRNLGNSRAQQKMAR